MKIKINHILSAVAAALLALCVMSVWSPIRFSGVRSEREAAVKARLVEIRKAEEAYKKMNGCYAGSFRQLVDSRLLADSMRMVPFGGGKEFELTATVHTGKSGTPVSIMECGATYQTYLGGLDENAVREITEEANSRGEYPGLKFGDITQPNDNAGNWE